MSHDVRAALRADGDIGCRGVNLRSDPGGGGGGRERGFPVGALSNSATITINGGQRGTGIAQRGAMRTVNLHPAQELRTRGPLS